MNTRADETSAGLAGSEAPRKRGTGATDDRGQPVAILSFADLKRVERDPNQRRAALARRLRDAVRAESRRSTPLRAVVIVTLVVVVWAAWAVVVTLAPSFRSVPIFWIVVVASVVGFRIWARRAAAGNLARTAVAEGVCGACAYSLQDLATEADGCLVCPECGAAWRAERITRPHWEGANAGVTYQPGWLKRSVFNIPSPRDMLAPDDRGRFVPVMDSYLKLLPPARREEWGRARRRALVSRLRAVGWVPRALLAVVSTLPCWLVGGALWVGSGFSIAGPPARGVTPELLWLAGVMAAVACLIGLAVYWSNRFGPPLKLVPVFRAAGVCASCGQDLGGVAVASDGCRACPDCGAAWRAEGVGAVPGGSNNRS